jgi:hypothetical protein
VAARPDRSGSAGPAGGILGDPDPDDLRHEFDRDRHADREADRPLAAEVRRQLVAAGFDDRVARREEAVVAPVGVERDEELPLALKPGIL